MAHSEGRAPPTYFPTLMYAETLIKCGRFPNIRSRISKGQLDY